jgi:phospholipase C
MAEPLDSIDTIVVVMLENRSFDHQLGYLSLPPYNWPNVDGLKPGMMNSLSGADFPIFHLSNPEKKLPDDPPHDRYDVSLQLTGLPGPAGPPPHPMIGFVESYSQIRPIDTSDQPIVMGYYTGQDLPATNFFVQNYGICDRWFSALPSGTQSNRLMAMSGSSRIDQNQGLLLPNQRLVYDWLEHRKIRWRVYHCGVPFAVLINGWHLRVLADDHFRDYGAFQDDVLNEKKKTFPQVIFIEPRYADAPHFEAPTDDHPPSPALDAQRFLLRIYSDLMTNPARWSKSVLMVTYDEHGGFFDHVSPLPIRTEPPGSAKYPAFESTGVRVPAYVISPFVEAKSVYSQPLDHTSILKFMAAKFAGGKYSPAVDRRPVGNLVEVLTRSTARTDAPLPPPPNAVGRVPGTRPAEPIPLAFQNAMTKAVAKNPAAAKAKFPEWFSHFQ